MRRLNIIFQYRPGRGSCDPPFEKDLDQPLVEEKEVFGLAGVDLTISMVLSTERGFDPSEHSGILTFAKPFEPETCAADSGFRGLPVEEIQPVQIFG